MVNEILARRFPDHITLEEVYVPLQATDELGNSETFLLSDAISSAFSAGTRQILIEGLPGSGKSTLLRQIARHAWDKPESVGLDRRYIALPLRLQSYALSLGASREESIWRAIDRAQEPKIQGPPPPPGFYEAWPRQLDAPWLYLLDAFDEVPAEQRDDVVIWLRRLARDGTPFIVTSRPTSELPDAFRQELERKELKQFVVQPFSAEQQKQLAERWLGGRAASFQTAFSRFAGGELGGTPLLLTIAAIVFDDTGELPRRRSELYRQFVEDTWKEALKHVDRDESIFQRFQDLPTLVPLCLRKLALSMTEGKGEASTLDFGNDVRSLTRSLAKVLGTALNLSELIADSRAEELVKFLEARSGVLRATAHQFEWMHPTFREFLAAEELAEKSNPAQIEAILRRFQDAAWRQVVLFLVGILSERRSVAREIRLLNDMEPPFGLALAGYAISEGADVDGTLASDVVRGLCDVVRDQAAFKTGLCARALTVDGGGAQARGALLPFMKRPEVAQFIDPLKHDLVQLAYLLDQDNSCPIGDLRDLQARDTLAEIASSPGASFTVRIDAAKAMYSLGGTDGYRALEELTVAATGDPKSWPGLISALAGLDAPELYATLASRGVLADSRFGELLDNLKAESKQKVLGLLAADARLSEDQLLAVRLRSAEDTEYLDTLIPSLIDRPALLTSCLNVIIRSGNRSALLRAALSPDIPLANRTEAVRALRNRRMHDELKQLVASEDLPFSLRRRSAEYLYKSPVDKELASFLLDFFNSMGTHSERPVILVRRGFFHYILEQYTEAISLFERVFSQRPATSWELSIFGHCLESLYRRDEALAAYAKALELDPGNVFARCRRAVVRWQAAENTLALADVEQLGLYRALVWFQPIGGDILRRCDKFDEAEEWLNAGVKNDTSSATARAFRGKFEFERGRFRDAIADFEAALALDPSYRWARIEFPPILRAADKLAEAANAYTELLSDSPGNWSFLSQRAEILLRMGKFAQADLDLAALVAQHPNEPFFLYLEALSKCFQGDRTALPDAARLALETLNKGGIPESAILSNKALCLLVLNQGVEAQAIFDELIKSRDYDRLRSYTIPHLDDLAHALLDRTDIAEARDRLKSLVWPDGLGEELEANLRRAALKRLEREREPYCLPMYCQKPAIQGLVHDGSFAKRILDNDHSSERTIVLWTIARPDHIFGRCNFKQRNDSEYEFKFSETTDTILSQNLRVLVESYGVRRLLFLEPELLEKFEGVIAAEALSVTCVLADVPPPPS